jgi:hypothetical protein
MDEDVPLTKRKPPGRPEKRTLDIQCEEEHLYSPRKIKTMKTTVFAFLEEYSSTR